MSLDTALLAAIGALTSAVVALFYLYVRQRDTDERKYQSFTAQMLPLLTELKAVASEMNALVRQVLSRIGGPR